MGSGSSKGFSYDEALLKDKNSWTYEVPDSKEEGHTPVYRNPKFPNGFDIPVGEKGQKLDNVWALFERSCEKFPEANCMGFRPYQGNERGEFKYISYAHTREICENISSALKNLGMQQQDTVGIYSKNRAEWMQVHLANQKLGLQTVALYDTLGEEAVAYIVDHSELKLVFCEKGSLKNVLKGNCERLQTVVVFDHQEIYGNPGETLDQADLNQANEAGVKLMGMSEFIETGVKNGPVANADVPGDSCCFLMYTSGTTGKPKGVQLSHAGFCTVAFAVDAQSPFLETDRHMSFLPLAHIFECLVELTILNSGASVAYYQGNIKKLTEDWVAVKPTIIIGVPRVFSKVYGKAMAKTDTLGCFKKMLFNMALKASSDASRQGKRVEKWDNKIWGAIAKQIGFDECRLCLSGAAPLPPYLAEFLRVILTKGVIVQGYGMTESTGGSVCQLPEDLQLGNVGIPLGGVDLRLQDIPEMNYMTTDEYPRGEILLRGPPIMIGYLKNEKATNETIVDGWLHTGDVGRMNPNGSLSIIDRKKNIFKTAFGEYIAVEKIESAYGKAGAISQVWIYGNSFKSFVVAVVVPDALRIKDVLIKAGGWTMDGSDEPVPGTPAFATKFKAMVDANHEVVKNAVLAEMRAQEGALKRFERVKDIMLECEIDNLLQGFSVENNLLTPSFKMRRPILLKKYVDQLKNLYATNGEAPKADEHWVKN